MHRDRPLLICAEDRNKGSRDVEEQPMWDSRARRSIRATRDASHGHFAVEYPWHAPVAQLDRASAFGAEGWEFESLRAHHFVTSPTLFRSGLKMLGQGLN